MKKLFLFLIGCCLALTAPTQLLFKISGNGLAAPSYVIGTHHLAPRAFIDSIAGLQEALTATQQVYGELDLQEMMKPENAPRLQAAMLFTDGRTLESVLSAERYQRLAAYLQTTFGIDLNNPTVKAQLNSLKPGALNIQLTTMLYQKNHPGFNPQQVFDGYFQETARSNGKPVGSLETLDFQIKTLFEGATLERQIEQLMCTVDDADFAEESLSRLTAAFFAQDLELLRKIMEEKRDNGCDMTPEEENALIFRRNATWAQQMPAIMQARPTFFAVGAAHLPGDKGVLALLKTAGYTVEPVR